MSPPSRGRGSKQPEGLCLDHPLPSPPSQGRGSKPDQDIRRETCARVASFTGAWIETSRTRPERTARRCRLLHGAVDRNVHTYRIDYDNACRLLHGGVDRNISVKRWPRRQRASPPSRGRGSKPEYVQHAEGVDESPPSRGVDRNLQIAVNRADRAASPPSRGRGSKHIECFIRRRDRAGRLLHGGVDRNNVSAVGTAAGAGRLLHGGVDRNYDKDRLAAAAASRLLDGGVDRNVVNSGDEASRSGRLLAPFQDQGAQCPLLP